ncbi:putative small metal-binding protein [Catalinimonas alkaloidigena]|uniref:DUF1059 domain-containing protein n=1 Tax=Catalinimonas alkaloidigena TaxID=1075417 RepID=UPI002405E604|nr:DUF1059 domain-containing protein [Catalinimonas alkaloidigena]MDF9796980.1 putative small metal-binding protein [Catalinimonas alkaloidigena]
MEKVIHCRDLGFNCDGIIRAQTEKEALQLAADHAQKAHGLGEITPELEEKLKSVLREEHTATLLMR